MGFGRWPGRERGHLFGLDLCGSVRTEDRLDPVKLRDFFSAIA